MKSRTTISANQHALIRMPSKGFKIAYLREDGVISLGKFGTFKVLSILGHPFGSAFEIGEDNEALPIKALHSHDDMMENEEAEDDLDAELDKNALTKYFEKSAESNQDIINIGSSIQTLDNKQIDELKKHGALSDTGQKIIELIIAGHGGFDKKTFFSQQKYLRRKQMKFLKRFQVDYVGSSELLQFFVEKDIQKAMDMCEESLGLLLSHANVRPGGRYLVIDDTSGIVTYALMERMQGQGSIMIVHENEHPNLAALRYSDYSDEHIQSMIKSVSWLQLVEPENEQIEWEDLPQEAIDELKPAKRAQYYKRQKRAAEINDALADIQRGNYDALISCTTLSIPSFIPYVIPLVGGSRPIVFYSAYKELLLEAQHEMTKDKRALAPSIYESRARKYQTIQGRLHPIMTLRGYGGYVLCAIRVFPAENNIQAIGKGNRKKPKTEDSKESLAAPDKESLADMESLAAPVAPETA